MVNKTWTLTLSPTFAPRYQEFSATASTDDLPAAVTAKVVEASKLPYKFNVNVQILSPGRIEELICHTHKI